ncbi:MAG: hypothetical protein IME96_07705 [Proteobacteria bacterium]|nr:hypothetical protein [Pseudomonadota bacterium]
MIPVALINAATSDNMPACLYLPSTRAKDALTQVVNKKDGKTIEITTLPQAEIILGSHQ